MAAQSPVFDKSQSFEDMVLPIPKIPGTTVPSKNPESHNSFE